MKSGDFPFDDVCRIMLRCVQPVCTKSHFGGKLKDKGMLTYTHTQCHFLLTFTHIHTSNDSLIRTHAHTHILSVIPTNTQMHFSYCTQILFISRPFHLSIKIVRIISNSPECVAGKINTNLL